MDKWSFNTPLFSRLPEILDLTGTEIARRAGLRQQVLSRYTQNETVVSVQTLIKLCNSLRMPAYYFVAEDDNFIIPNRESATIPIGQWHPIGWDCQAVEQTFGDGEGRIYWKDVAVIMGASSQKPHERFTLRRRFKVTDFLSTCSRLDISPFRFLIDKNRKEDMGKPGRQTGAANDSYSTASEEAMIAEMASLKKSVGKLSETVADLTGKYESLLGRHTALLKRHDQLEAAIREYLGFDIVMPENQ